MGKKIFVSYKYSDSSVYPLARAPLYTTVRHYVDELQELLTEGDHINKGEADGEDLSDFKDSTIESSLRDKIYDSSVTVILISPNMKETWSAESNQWIPWEVSYSLKEHSRNRRTSGSNALLAVVLPDASNSYEYYLKQSKCTTCTFDNGCTTHMTDRLFQILRDNTFNAKDPSTTDCGTHSKTYSGEASYMTSVRWDSFKVNVGGCIDRAIRINDDIDSYTITKEIK